MDGIRNLRNEPTEALRDIVARCRPYFDRGESQALTPAERQRYYAALFILAERGGLMAMDWQMRDGGRIRDDRARVSLEAGAAIRPKRAANAA